MKQLEYMKENLMSCVMGQMGDLKNVDAKELGEAIDMIKDLSEAIYYCTITEAMHGEGNGHQPQKEMHYYTERVREPYMMRDEDHPYGRMYYPNGNSNGNGNGSSTTASRTSGGMTNGSRSYYEEREYPMMDMRDPREGRSYMSRKMYMESKEMGRDKLGSIQDLEHYMSELSEDVTEMIQNASPEEKQLLQKKLNMLAQKVVSG